MTDPLAHPGVIKLVLGPVESAVLKATGERCFVLVGRETYPGDPSRMAIMLLPVPLETAQAAESVALGKARAVVKQIVKVMTPAD